MRYLLIVVALVIGACRVDGTDGDAWTDADIEVDGEHGDAAWCSYQEICGGVECSRSGVCEVDITCQPRCVCWVGSHAEGLACVPD